MSLDENRPRGNDAVDADWPRLTPLASPTPALSLWWSRLQVSPQLLRRCEGLLSDQERIRAARFGTAPLRQRYVVGRASLRRALGGVLRIDPGAVAIVRGTRGRPQLSDARALDFNVSHTGDAALIGVVRIARVGVDIERAERSINVAGIARKFLTAQERATVASLDAEAGRRAALRLWTCKEAMAKATGDALSAPFALIDIDLSDGLRVRDGPGVYQPARWSLHAVSAPNGFIATVAIWRPA